MKTEPPPARPPVLMLSGLEWRLLLTSVLASTYLVVWLALSRSLPPEAQATAPPIARQGTRVERGQGPVWLSDLLLSRRPVVTLPAGWTHAAPPTRAARPRMVRAPATRPVRVRTRSS